MFLRVYTALGALKKATYNLTNAQVRAKAGLLVATKSTDETINSDATLSDDSDLVVAVEANTNYRFECALVFNSGTTPDFKGQINLPTGATLRSSWYSSGGLTWSGGMGYEASTFTARGDAIYDIVSVITGRIKVAGTAGNVVMQWAQDTSDAGDTTLLEGSHMILTKLS